MPKGTYEMVMECQLSSRVLALFDPAVMENITQSDLQGVVQAVIMDAIAFGKKVERGRIITQSMDGKAEIVFSQGGRGPGNITPAVVPVGSRRNQDIPRMA